MFDQGNGCIYHCVGALPSSIPFDRPNQKIELIEPIIGSTASTRSCDSAILLLAVLSCLIHLSSACIGILLKIPRSRKV